MEEQQKEQATVSIAGTKYFVDLAGEALLPEDKNLKRVNLKDCEISMQDNWIYIGHYDLERREQVVFPEDIKTMPGGKIVEIILPSYRELDPPTWFELHGERLNVSKEIIEGLPLHHQALIVPLNKSDLALRVEENNINLDDLPQLQSTIEIAGHSARKLPELNIEGTTFLVDVIKGELREQENEQNVIAFKDMVYMDTHYLMDYDRDRKNIADDSGNVSWDHRIAHMVSLDPEGMALRTGRTIEEVKGKNDFELIVDQVLLEKRLQGQLPVIDIIGHPFYVDLRMGTIRPKDDFSTEGIRFADIAYEDSPDGKHYMFPYDPVKREPVLFDPREITEIPKGLILIEIPIEPDLDPVSYARLGGWDMKQILLEHPIQGKMKASIVPWEEVGIKEIIKDNKEPELKKDQQDTTKDKKAKRIKRGKGI